MMLRPFICLALTFAALGCSLPTSAGASVPLDTVVFGDGKSEAAHGVVARRSDVVKGGFDLPARRLLPMEKAQPDGGTIGFTMKCDPQNQNYATLKLWGSDFGVKKGRLYLFVDGKQAGHRHLGDITPFDIATDEAACPGRFFYTTLPLPLSFTQGKTRVTVEVRARGWLYGYGTSYESFQRKLEQPTRGIYAAYTHPDGFFTPPVEEKQGVPPANPPARTQPGEEKLQEIKTTVNKSVEGEFRHPSPPGLGPLKFLARAYHVPWTVAYRNPKTVQEVVRGIDRVAQTHNKNPEEAKKEWAGYGAAGDAIRLLREPLKTVPLDEAIDDGLGGKAPRRELWSKALQASRDYKRMHRQRYTNQTMIADMNIYLANRGLQVIDPAHAFPEDQARRYLHEAMGILPWLGNDTPKGKSDRGMGDDFFVFTKKGLSRELGYVGYYGEVQAWALQLWDATDYQDDRIREQVLKIARARSCFRHPSVDLDGFRAMRLESIVGWRDFDFPGRVLYGMEAGREGSALMAAALLKDPMNVGFAQQMLADGQYFVGFDSPRLGTAWNVRTMRMYAVGEYETVKSLPPSAERLPGTAGQPDFAFADEEDGVIAIKHGDDFLYVSLYWRARFAVNFLARVHHITPRFERVATVRTEAQFTPRGNFYTRPDKVDWDIFKEFAPAGEVHQALAGEQLPVAQEPKGLRYHPAQENHYSGRAEFYTLRYGPYLIGMNTTTDKTFELKTPAGAKQARDLISGQMMTLASPLKLPPLSTVVLDLGGK